MNSPQVSPVGPEEQRPAPRFRVVRVFNWGIIGFLAVVWVACGAVAFNPAIAGGGVEIYLGVFGVLGLFLAVVAVRSFTLGWSLRSHPLVKSGLAHQGGLAALGRGVNQVQGYLFLTPETVVFSERGGSGKLAELPLKRLVLMKRDLKRDPQSSAFHLLAPGTGREMWLTPKLKGRWEYLIRQAAARQGGESQPRR